MGQTAANYKPSLTNINKYYTYFNYFKEYISCRDFKSLFVSLNYIFTHKLPAENYQTRSKMGVFQIRKNTTDFQFINLAYENKIRNYLLKNIDNFDVFIDVGACIGEYCIWLSKKGKKCIAIEPVNFSAVKNNIDLNHLKDQIQVFECGLGSKKEKVYFNLPVGNTGSSHIERTANKEPNVFIERLDDLITSFNISENDRVIVKLDVEGMETEVIEGAKNFIRNHRNLSIIYEHFKEDNFKNDKALIAITNFKVMDLDPINRIAIKL